jgi:hypothetical protein
MLSIPAIAAMAEQARNDLKEEERAKVDCVFETPEEVGAN